MAREESVKKAAKPGASSKPDTSAAAALTPTMPSIPAMQLVPEKLQEIQKQYLESLSKVFTSQPEMIKMAAQDRRFNNPAWLDSYYSGLAALYVLNSKTLQAMTDAVQTDPKTHARLKFMVQQWIDAASPTNYFATNPEAQQKMVESQGESLRAGIENLMTDMRKGRISQTDEQAFEIGKNVAVTTGDVVFENELFQLIQYKPTTEQVGTVPLLMVPPNINKFYIMDLQPHSSLVKFAVDHGNTVFLVSWANVQDQQSKLTWDNYVEDGVLKALDVVLAISQQPKANLLGFCVGGTMSATALATLAARKIDKVNSFTLMTTLLDFAEPGVLEVFIDEQHVRLREQQLAKGGILKGSELATTFSFLRPNDLVWNYVVSNYLKGEKPTPFDLLYWNSDSTNLPGPFFSWYLRNMYHENNLVKKNKLTVCGEKMDLSSITVPTYAMGAREDHIVPWDSAWKSVTALGGPKRFVLGASGHIAGSINPASKNKRSYWVNETLGESAQQWLDSATEVPGSWWNDWAQWIKGYAGNQVEPPKQAGSADYPPIEPAPGRYVKVRSASE
ncbi:class I poly(R)-hydroxyalkanoic acid synthase [beta proteobacterium MWH-UniP1]